MYRNSAYRQEYTRIKDMAEGEPLWYKPFYEEGVAPMFGAAAIVRSKLLRSDRHLPRLANRRQAVYSAVEQLLEDDAFVFGKKGEAYEWNSEREEVDAIVIHHTGSNRIISNERLSAIELARLYVPVYARPDLENIPYVEGKPIYSGHFRDERQVFWPHQWMIGKDGDAERLLHDDEIGWQAGNWGVNKRSVSICFDGRLKREGPTKAAINTAAEVIANNYSHLDVSPDTLIGHNSVNKKTACPGAGFAMGWQLELIDMAESV